LGKERFSIVASKKVAPKATDRNALRRRIYETVRSVDPQGYSAVIFLKKGALEAPRKALRGGIEDALRNVRAY
jgi:ribonuclease P protein component